MIRAILHGVITIFISAIICSFIFALLLKLTSYDETSLQWVMHGLAFLSLFSVGLLQVEKGKNAAGCLVEQRASSLQLSFFISISRNGSNVFD